MNRQEKTYNAVCIFVGVFFLAIAFKFWLVDHRANPDDISYYIISGCNLVFGVVVLLSSIINFASNRLLFLPTLLQCIFMVFTLYGIAVTVWGAILLKKAYVKKSDVSEHTP